ncbi:ribonuclease P protein component [Flocculibacter collagenilyticus]|uniref:ribonuclease P protein component n=1 Tax=Flocculibacter collagenilyticus TaxID=2744479 RepID=UPI0018F2DB79|nr:ribonuclease P protein component [Flocculibacter collagenilyticus]
MVEHTFGRELRLLTPSQFSRIFNEPAKAASPFFTVLAKPNQLSHPRIGITVAKKRVKKAVNRNTVKRIVRESFRLNQHNLPPIDIVIMAKSGIDQQTNAELFKQLEKLWRKIAQRTSQE